MGERVGVPVTQSSSPPPLACLGKFFEPPFPNGRDYYIIRTYDRLSLYSSITASGSPTRISLFFDEKQQLSRSAHISCRPTVHRLSWVSPSQLRWKCHVVDKCDKPGLLVHLLAARCQVHRLASGELEDVAEVGIDGLENLQGYGFLYYSKFSPRPPQATIEIIVLVLFSYQSRLRSPAW